MFPTWRLRLREARLAVADGRWDDAAELLSSNSLRQYLPAKRLSTQLAGHLIQHSQQRIGEGESSAGWRDLNRAAALGADESEIMEVRRSQSRKRLDRAIELLDAGDVVSAAAELKQMEQRRLGATERSTWQRVAELLVESQRRAERGDFAIALSSLVKAQDLIPNAGAPALTKRLEEQRRRLRDQASRLPELDAGLHAALAERNWTDVLAAADALLELAPHHSAARRARRQAWKEVGMEVTQSHHGRRNEDWIHLRPQNRPSAKMDSTRRSVNNAKVDTVTYDPSQHRRLVAWIDAVGGYLICLGDEITLGQPSSGGEVDIPILADLSRRHATIRREGESYILKPIHDATVDGNAAVGPVVLRDKSVIGLGDAVQITFRKPHALSATATLEILTHHKTEPAVDGVVLMSDSCIVGAKQHSHIRCRKWDHDLVLFRRGDQLLCRTQIDAQLDGRPIASQAEINGDCRIEGEEFALSFEEI